MGKDGKSGGFLTPKAIANRIKSKGLQKLRWYCQMCQKQCRDENGFKCHTMSESHQRQLLLFADNPDDFLGTYSQEFRDGYLDLLRRQFGTKRVKANQVYQEYINDRDHVHMNSTQWETLTEFIKWLGREGLCVVDETEKGWFIQYVDRDPETLRKMEALKNREKHDQDDEERMAAFIQSQVEKGRESAQGSAETLPTELARSDDDDKVTFAMGETSKTGTTSNKPATANPLVAIKVKKPIKKESGVKRKSALDEIMEMEEQKKKKIHEQTAKKDYWLFPDIVVKIITKKLGEKYHKRKGVVTELKDKYTAVVKLLDSDKQLKLDQTHLETVLPALGKPVLILNGAFRTEEAELLKLNEERFSCDVRISAGPLKGKLVSNIPYEDVSKLQIK
ncbi:DNA/RNA-binding protein KIN17-like [Watersipora subatra]|uniref:DNA/RNA-binding protein KIN17-like n=1 Tax=Watersipora subatra TaxID=2589382 RepID=UPI00355C9486